MNQKHLSRKQFSIIKYCLFNCHLAQLRYLLKVGYNPNSRDKTGRTCLIMLCFAKDEAKTVKMAKILIHHGSKIDVSDPKGMNALHYACKYNKEGLVELFLNFTDDYDLLAQDLEGNCCLHYGGSSGNFHIVEMLINMANKYKMNTNVVNKNNETPRLLALKYGHMICAEKLIGIPKTSRTIMDDLQMQCDKMKIESKDDKGNDDNSYINNVNAILARTPNMRELSLDKNDLDTSMSSLSSYKGLTKSTVHKSLPSTSRYPKRQISVGSKQLQNAGLNGELDNRVGSSKTWLVSIYKLHELQTCSSFRKKAEKPPTPPLISTHDTDLMQSPGICPIRRSRSPSLEFLSVNRSRSPSLGFISISGSRSSSISRQGQKDGPVVPGKFRSRSMSLSIPKLRENRSPSQDASFLSFSSPNPFNSSAPSVIRNKNQADSPKKPSLSNSSPSRNDTLGDVKSAVSKCVSKDEKKRTVKFQRRSPTFPSMILSSSSKLSTLVENMFSESL